MTTANDWRISKVRTPVDKAILKAYQQGLRDGKATKPLRWRTGPVEEGELKEQHIIKNRNGNYQLVRGWTVQDWEKYIPLSDILELIGGER